MKDGAIWQMLRLRLRHETTLRLGLIRAINALPPDIKLDTNLTNLLSEVITAREESNELLKTILKSRA